MRWWVGSILAFLVLVSVMAWWSMIRMPGKSHRGALPEADARLQQLAADLRVRVEYLAEEIGERNVSRRPRQLAATADYIAAELSTYGYDVHRQDYEVSGVTCQNLEVEITGQARRDEIVVVGAHYDSVPGSPAANDNGSGAAALLSLAKSFAHRETDRSLRFVAFVNEEPPYFQTPQMGSWVYARRCHQRGENVTAMLSLETIGYYTDARRSQKYPSPFDLFYPSTGNFIGFVANRKSRDLVHRVIQTFRQNEPFPSQGCALPESVPGIDFSDQWSFWQEGYPAVMVTDTAMCRYPYYHTSDDTPDKIDFQRMARVVRGLQSVIEDLVEK
jgi:hypothetical protein